MAVDEFQRYVMTADSIIRQQILQIALIPSFRTALVSCIRALEEQQLNIDPHQEEDETLLKVYRELYNERGLYQDLLKGIEALRKKAVADGLIPDTSMNPPEIGRVEDVSPPTETSE